MGVFYKCLLCCCHFVISLWLFLAGIIRRLKVEVRDMKHSSFVEELAKSRLLIGEFRKTPEHLGVVLNEETFSFTDVANIVVWCLAVGVPYVSFYDLKGVVVTNKLKLYDHVVAAKRNLLEKNAHKYKIHIYCSSLKDEFESNVQNGHKYDGKVSISLLRRDDGKADIVRGIRAICNDVVKQKLKPLDIKQFHISRGLKALPGFPDPDIVLCFGRGQSLNGYLPWQIRLSEIMFFQTHHNFHFKDFMTVLRLFNHCEQRFGK